MHSRGVAFSRTKPPLLPALHPKSRIEKFNPYIYIKTSTSQKVSGSDEKNRSFFKKSSFPRHPLSDSGRNRTDQTSAPSILCMEAIQHTLILCDLFGIHLMAFEEFLQTLPDFVN